MSTKLLDAIIFMLMPLFSCPSYHFVCHTDEPLSLILFVCLMGGYVNQSETP